MLSLHKLDSETISMHNLNLFNEQLLARANLSLCWLAAWQMIFLVWDIQLFDPGERDFIWST